jgi:tRNA dimethylallyltransferase
LVEEARSLMPYRYLNALQTVGYTEIFDYFDNKLSLAEAIERIKINTRQYAKRQLTWFRRDEDIKWLTGTKI